MKPKLLIVEDDDAIQSQMRWALSQDYSIFLAQNRSGALEMVKSEKPSIVTLDLGLPPHPEDVSEGFLTLGEILEHDACIKTIVITGQGQKENALKAIGNGAYDFFIKPIQLDELKIVLNRASYVAQLERECREMQSQLSAETSFEGMLGTSPQIQQTFAAIRKVAGSDVPVLISGESGTGKEMVARAIHRKGLRKNGPMVVINCSAIPETLLESELFGHEKGAFTGAHIRRKGRFEMAQGGTLFLDEIGELSLPLQVKLLRFLQEQKIERVGGREEILVDTRILAATNLDLKKSVSESLFREDLYYRLSVLTIHLPPLRERDGDLLFLAKAMLQKFSDENKKKMAGFSEDAVEAIENYAWPGNIRELENRIKRAVIMADGVKITPVDLELYSSANEPAKIGLKEAREGLERKLIMKALSRNKGKISRVAEELGISRPTLYELMEKLRIER